VPPGAQTGKRQNVAEPAVRGYRRFAPQPQRHRSAGKKMKAKRHLLWWAALWFTILPSAYLFLPSYQYVHLRGRPYVVEATLWRHVSYFASCAGVEIDGEMRAMGFWNAVTWGVRTWLRGDEYRGNAQWHGLSVSGLEIVSACPIGGLGPGPVLTTRIPWYCNPYSWAPPDPLLNHAALAILRDNERWSQKFTGYERAGLRTRIGESMNDAVRRVAPTVRDMLCSYNDEKTRLQNQQIHPIAGQPGSG
jgi:hypothetical protein